MKPVRVILAFLAAVVVTEVTGAVVQTQFVLASLTDLGIEISLTQRLAMTIHDIAGLVEIYLPVIAVGFIIAFGIAALVVRWLLPGRAAIGYPLAGLTAVVAAIVIMTLMFDVSPIAGARSTPGLIGQALAGALGGWIFYRLTRFTQLRPLPEDAPGPLRQSPAP